MTPKRPKHRLVSRATAKCKTCGGPYSVRIETGRVVIGKCKCSPSALRQGAIQRPKEIIERVTGGRTPTVPAPAGDGERAPEGVSDV